MIALIEGKTYLIDGKKLLFEKTEENGELIVFKTGKNLRLEIPLEDLIGKDIQETNKKGQ